KWEKFKNLDFLVQQNDGAKTAVILFHGYGADASDLANLSKVYKLKESTDWYFPQGVLEVPIGPMMTGRAWFELRVSDFEQVAEGKIVHESLRPKEDKLLTELSQWLNLVGKHYDKVFIGGFSQGAILTSHSFYRLNFSPAGLLLLSGFLVAPQSFPTLPQQLKVPFFQSHGERDEVLNIKGAQQLYNKLQEAGLSGQWMSFQGGHEIPMDVIAETQIFLNSVLSP
ncbi:MAG: hypothetical protein AAF203_08855, partial [Pseudomonadota bacterium]